MLGPFRFRPFRHTFRGLIYGIREQYTRSSLLKFYNSFAKFVQNFALILYENAAKTHLMKVENAQRRILRATFFRRKFDSLNNTWYKHKNQTVSEMFISELIKEMFKQIRLEFPVQCFTPYSCKKSHFPNYGSSRTNNPSKYYRTVVKRKCLENSFQKGYNYMLNLDLVPQNFLKMTKSEMKSYVDSVSLIYVRDNREVLSWFFRVWKYIYSI